MFRCCASRSNAASVRFLNAFSAIGWTLLSIMWFGVTSLTVIFAISAVLVPFALVNMSAGLANIDPEFIEMAGSFTRRRLRMFTLVIVPSLYPFIFATLRIMFGVAWKVTLTAELFGGNSGPRLHDQSVAAGVRHDDDLCSHHPDHRLRALRGPVCTGTAAGERVAPLCPLSEPPFDFRLCRALPRRGDRRARPARLVGIRAPLAGIHPAGATSRRAPPARTVRHPDFLRDALTSTWRVLVSIALGAPHRRRPRLPCPRRARRLKASWIGGSSRCSTPFPRSAGRSSRRSGSSPAASASYSSRPRS